MSDNLIVTRHTPLVDWLRQRGIHGRVVAHATPADVEGRDVYGILPLWLAAKTNSITEVSLPGLPLEARQRVNGGDFTVAEMDEWGATMNTFFVRTPDRACDGVQGCGAHYFKDGRVETFY